MRNKFIKQLFIVHCSLFIYSTFNIQHSTFAHSPKYSNEFLSIGVGARAFAMGNSAVAITNDVYSGYWNPAGLSLLHTDWELSLMHSEYFAGIAKYDYGSLAARIDATSTAGISFIRFGVDDIPDTSELIDSEGNIHYDNIKSFSAVDYAFLFSFAKMTKINGFRYGANAKIIHRIAGSFAKSWGFGLDLGLRYDFNKWTFGLMCRDVSSTFNAWDYSFNDQMIKVFSITGNEIPKNTLEVTKQSFILGAARKFSILNSHLSILPAIDFDITTDGERNVLLKGKSIGIAPHAGLELGYRNIVFVRGGITNIQKESDMNGNKSRTFQPNLGAGVNIKNILSIDYALTDIGNNSLALYSNIFSLKLNINRKK